MSYQDRKDIDRILDWINRNKYNIDDNSSALGRLDEDLTDFSSSLITLKGNLVSFNAKLIDFDEDNTNLDEDLNKLGENLEIFTNAVTTLSEDLTEFQSDLTGFDVQLNGDATHTGFATTLSNIQTAMYGGQGYDIEHPSPTSLKGQLVTFGQQLADLDTSDAKLALTLGTLSGYLSTFQGTLAEFRQQIIDDLGQSVYDGLDDEIIKLIGSITSANQDISDHQDLIDDVQDTIGDANSGLVKQVNDTSTLANTTSTQANAIQNTVDNTLTPRVNQLRNTDVPAIQNILYGNGTEQSPSTNSVLSNISDVQSGLATANSNIDDFDEILNGDGTSQNVGLISEVNTTITQIGDTQTDGTILYDIDKAKENISNNHSNLNQILSPNITRTEIWLCGGIPSTQDLWILEDYGYDISHIEYALTDNGALYKLYGSSWARYYDELDLTGCVGVLYEMPSTYFDENVFHYVDLPYIYEVKSTKYYKFTVSS